ncbi:hypothetical protein [Pelolinea submarina]|uniref:hypothetical protein n=1 Tax=Pelolinea submarina TaxID=913107 RepID=UPI000F81DA83|nr:hypothetical protein [Pelolinea submarina]
MTFAVMLASLCASLFMTSFGAGRPGRVEGCLAGASGAGGGTPLCRCVVWLLGFQPLPGPACDPVRAPARGGGVK